MAIVTLNNRATNRSDTASAGQVFTATSATAADFQAAGKILQVVSVVPTALVTGTGTIPYDDTIPQNSEGNEVMTLAITPTNASNKLLIVVTALISTTQANSNTLGMALFQDSTASALSATNVNMPYSTSPEPCVIQHVMDAGTTSATTFKIRVGGHASGTTSFNGSNGARRFGGVCNSSIVIMEIKV